MGLCSTSWSSNIVKDRTTQNTAIFRAEPPKRSVSRRGFLNVPHFQGERQGQLLPRGRMADVMGTVPRRLIQILKARAQAM